MNNLLSLNPNIKKQENKELEISNKDKVTTTSPLSIAKQEATDANNSNAPASGSNITEGVNNTTTNNNQDNKEKSDYELEYERLKNDKDYLKFVADTYHAKESYKRLQGPSRVSKSINESIRDNYASGIYIPVVTESKGALDGWQKAQDAIEHDKTILYDYIAKYGNIWNFSNLDEKEIEKAKARYRIARTKNVKDLSQEDKDYLLESDTIAGRVWDKITFKDENQRLEEAKANLGRRQLDAGFVSDLVKLSGTSDYNSFMSFFSSAEEKAKARDKFLTEGSQIVQRYGYDDLAIDKRTNKVVVIKGNKVYTPDIEGFFRNFDKILANNFTDVVFGVAGGVGGGVVKGVAKVGEVAVKKAFLSNLAKESTKAGMASAVASPIDYVQNRGALGLDIDTKELLHYTVGNALASGVATAGIGLGIKGIEKSINVTKAIKDLKLEDIKNIKVNNILSNEDMAINRKLAKFDKKELNKNYEIFKKLQSDTIISKDIEFLESGDLVDTEKYIITHIKANSIKTLKLYRTYIYNGVHYYILKGKGSIEITQMPHYKPVFHKIKLENLRYFINNLVHSSLDYDEQQQIELFYKIYTYNEYYREPRLYNEEYTRLEKRLFNVINCGVCDSELIRGVVGMCECCGVPLGGCKTRAGCNNIPQGASNTIISNSADCDPCGISVVRF